MSQHRLFAHSLCRCFVIILLLFTTSIFASEIDHSLNFWGGVTRKGNLSEDVLYQFEFQGRFYNSTHVFDRADITAGIGFKNNENNTMWIGYEVYPIYRSRLHKMVYEQLLWQQIDSKINYCQCASVGIRSRLEERHDSENSDIALTFRQKITILFPHIISCCWRPVFSEEYYFNLNNPDWVAHKLFNQNRLFIGIDILQSHNATLRIGYLNRLQLRNPVDQLAHILYISFIT